MKNQRKYNSGGKNGAWVLTFVQNCDTMAYGKVYGVADCIKE
jgi:hypothetical protein